MKILTVFQLTSVKKLKCKNTCDLQFCLCFKDDHEVTSNRGFGNIWFWLIELKKLLLCSYYHVCEVYFLTTFAMT